MAANAPKPYTPLAAAVLIPGTSPAAAAVPALVARLLAAGADPLAHSVRRRCSVLRCAAGSEFLANGALEAILASLEAAAAQRRLTFGSGNGAVVRAAAVGRESALASLWGRACPCLLAGGLLDGAPARLRCGSLAPLAPASHARLPCLPPGRM